MWAIPFPEAMASTGTPLPCTLTFYSVPLPPLHCTPPPSILPS